MRPDAFIRQGCYDANMRRFLCIAVSAALVVSMADANYAKAQAVPGFGDLAIYTIPCDVPPAFLTYAVPIGASPPAYMFLFPGTIYWPFYVPYQPASFGLGLYVPVLIPCGIYVGVTIVIVGYGVFALWGASSP
ncbi:MAG: hypothetical protein HY221_00930 [Candidatus Sungbacteria bacterium]|uniref:Uncharacterized protein n=1 Tax=Candidatus Sungiibacteriota bacterium TaxID=2750080 RepID=A0A932VQV2_9BACT|nr:hypothetical protein [Candidatus Sungbacteria bacterium]